MYRWPQRFQRRRTDFGGRKQGEGALAAAVSVKRSMDWSVSRHKRKPIICSIVRFFLFPFRRTIFCGGGFDAVKPVCVARRPGAYLAGAGTTRALRQPRNLTSLRSGPIIFATRPPVASLRINQN
jgi:hypothetical protein